MPKPVGSATDGFPDWQRDRLTGYPLDEKGGYRVPVVIDGVRYSPRFYQCGSAECLAVGANIDFSDPDTLKWIRANEAKALDNASTALSAAAVFTPAGPASFLSSASSVMGLVSGYLSGNEDLKMAEVSLSEGFRVYAVKRGLSKEAAFRVTNVLSATGFWREAIEGSIRFDNE